MHSLPVTLFKMAGVQVTAIPGWEALFMEMDQFLIALERNKDTANQSYAEYAVERLGVHVCHG